MESESLFGANLCICMPRTLYFDLTVPTFLFVSFKRGGGNQGNTLERKRFLNSGQSSARTLHCNLMLCPREWDVIVGE